MPSSGRSSSRWAVPTPPGQPTLAHAQNLIEIPLSGSSRWAVPTPVVALPRSATPTERVVRMPEPRPLTPASSSRPAVDPYVLPRRQAMPGQQNRGTNIEVDVNRAFESGSLGQFERQTSGAKQNRGSNIQVDVDMHSANGRCNFPTNEQALARQRSSDGGAQSPTPSAFSFSQSRASPSATPDYQQFPAAPPSLTGGRSLPASTRTASSVEFESATREPRILVTGASGLLGRQVLEALAGFCVRGLCHSRGRPPLVVCDLTVDGEAARQIMDFRPHVVIHLAGERRSDILRRAPAHARLLNVDSSGGIAAACEYCGAWLIFVSADAVFDGTDSPHAENAYPNPLSEYGWHKLHAEKLVVAACPRAAILRVPLLYGPVESLNESVVTAIYGELRRGELTMDNCRLWCPTWTGDVARVMRAMVDMHLAGTELRGTYHWQGRDQVTKCDIARIISSACGFEAPSADMQATSARSSVSFPESKRLDCSRLDNLFASMRIRPPATSLHEGLRICLSPFHGKELTSLQKIVELAVATKVDIPRGGACAEQVLIEKPGNAPRDACSETTAASSTPDGLRDQPFKPHARQLIEAAAENADQGSALGTPSREDRHASRAAALKNVFREELELAWRRYRDAAYDGKGEEDLPSRSSLDFLKSHDSRRGVVV